MQSIQKFQEQDFREQKKVDLAYEKMLADRAEIVKILFLRFKECQNLEQVWRCSPRLIENYTTDFPYEYVRAIRPEWMWRPRIVECHLIDGETRTKRDVSDEFFQKYGLG